MVCGRFTRLRVLLGLLWSVYTPVQACYDGALSFQLRQSLEKRDFVRYRSRGSFLIGQKFWFEFFIGGKSLVVLYPYSSSYSSSLCCIPNSSYQYSSSCSFYYGSYSSSLRSIPAVTAAVVAPGTHSSSCVCCVCVSSSVGWRSSPRRIGVVSPTTPLAGERCHPPTCLGNKPLET